MRPCVRRRCAGLTLLETLCALAILTVVAGSAVLGEQLHLRAVADAHRELCALEEAESELEAARLAPPPPGSTERALDAAPLSGAHLVRTVRALDDGELAVDVRVTWGAERRDVTLSTRVAATAGDGR